MKKVLFLPVGMTDPIRYFRDGAVLNIIRNYKPDVVFLYMSKGILEYHKKDNRYVYSIEQLKKHIGIDIDIKVIDRPELEDVQLFDSFIGEYTDILSELHKEYPDYQVLLNVSSGTPAMKSSLQILSLTLDFETIV